MQNFTDEEVILEKGVPVTQDTIRFLDRVSVEEIVTEVPVYVEKEIIKYQVNSGGARNQRQVAGQLAAHIARIPLALPLSQAAFDEEKQSRFVDAIAAAAGVSREFVVIDKLEDADLTTKRIRVEVSVRAADKSAAAAISARLTADSINRHAIGAGLPAATQLENAVTGVERVKEIPVEVEVPVYVDIIEYQEKVVEVTKPVYVERHVYEDRIIEREVIEELPFEVETEKIEYVTQFVEKKKKKIVEVPVDKERHEDRIIKKVVDKVSCGTSRFCMR